MKKLIDLTRFLEAQKKDYPIALQEIKNGQKRSHWIWYIFPQVKGLGLSEKSNYYGIIDLEEADAFLAHPVLGPRLLEITEAILSLPGADATSVMGSPDDLKLRSSMTLFGEASRGHDVFEKVLVKYFGGKKDARTLEMLGIL